MSTIKRSSKIVLAATAATLALLCTPPTGEAHTVPAKQCRQYAATHTFVTGNPAKGKAALRNCLAAADAHADTHPLPDVLLPLQVRLIRACESGKRDEHGNGIDGTYSYTADNPSPDSDASGGYGYLNSTWQRGAAGKEKRYARAKDAPPRVQDRRMLRNWANGTDPWKESSSCWS